MSKSVGIVAEYNPFHTGHRYQIDQLRQLGFEHIAVAMSGSCVQRGNFAFMDKFSRRKMALENGVDIVAEIPYPFSARSAEGYAMAGIQTLKAMGVDAISFGSESGNSALLQDIAAYLLTDEYENLLKKYISENFSFATAREKAIFDKFDVNKDIVSASNDILAIEYIKSCIILDWKPEIIAVKRQGAAYNRTKASSGYASASGIRKMISEYKQDTALKYIPAESSSTFVRNLDRGNYFVSDSAAEKAVLFTLRQKTAEDFIKLADCNEELSHSFEKALSSAYSMESLFDALPTKRYTRARLNRIILAAILNIDNSYPKDIQYIRILGFSKKGEVFMRSLPEKCHLPFSHSAKILSEKSELCRKIILAESRATDGQAALFRISRPPRADFTTKIVKV